MKVTKDNLFTIRIDRRLEQPLNGLKHEKRLNSYSEVIDLLLGNYYKNNPVYSPMIRLHFKANLQQVKNINEMYTTTANYSYLEKLYIVDIEVVKEDKEQAINWIHELGVADIEEKI